MNIAELQSTDLSILTEATLVEPEPKHLPPVVPAETDFPTLVVADKVIYEERSERDQLAWWLKVIYITAGVLAIVLLILGLVHLLIHKKSR